MNKLHKKLFPNVNLNTVHGTGMQIFDAEIAYIPHEVHRPHPSEPRFEHCNILGLDWLRLNRVVLDFKQMTLNMLTEE